MKVYKFLEQEPKIYGLRIRDWLFVVVFGGGSIFTLKILEIIGLNLGLYGTLMVALMVGLSIFYLRKFNREKCPNFLDAFISYKLYQPKYILPNNDILKKSEKKD
jgi:hypothetical protein